jgi:hypothetical protein
MEAMSAMTRQNATHAEEAAALMSGARDLSVAKHPSTSASAAAGTQPKPTRTANVGASVGGSLGGARPGPRSGSTRAA